MFLRLKYKGKTKKLIFKEKYKSHTELLSLCKKVTGLEPENIRIKFKDVKNDDLSIITSEDIEYFLEQDKESNFKNLIVEDIEEKAQSTYLDNTKSSLFVDLSGNRSEGDILDNLDNEAFDNMKLANNTAIDDISLNLSKTNNTILAQNQELHNYKNEFDVDISNIEIQKNNIEFSLDQHNNTTKQRIKGGEEGEGKVNLREQFQHFSKEFDHFKCHYDERLTKIENTMLKINKTLLEIVYKLKESKIIKDKNRSTKNTTRNNTRILKDNSVYYDIKCNECGKSPIINKRFVCKVCNDFNLCGDCHKKVDHEHDLHELFDLSYNNQKNDISLSKLDITENNEMKSVFIKKSKGKNTSRLDANRNRKVAVNKNKTKKASDALSNKTTGMWDTKSKTKSKIKSKKG